jgi:hypothetical protein
MEAFNEAGDAVNGHDGLLSQESIADFILGVLVERCPDVLGDRAVFGKFNFGSCLTRCRGVLCLRGMWRARRLRVGGWRASNGSKGDQVSVHLVYFGRTERCPGTH